MKGTACTLLTVALTAMSCTREAPTAIDPAQVSPRFAAAGSSGCYTVAGTISETGVFPDFHGAVTGDLVGTSTSSLSLDGRATGNVLHQPGDRRVTITGGTVPELVGTTLHETFEGPIPLNAGGVTKIENRVRIVEGVRLGNLTEHGTLDASTFPWTVSLRYEGVICP